MSNSNLAPSPYIIETSPLRKTYQTRKKRVPASSGRPVEAGKAASDEQGSEEVAFPALKIPRGGLVAIMGVSGVGKSTLLNLLAGLDRPERVEGAASCWIKLNFAGPRPETVDIAADQARIPRHRIGFVFQQGHLLSNTTVGLNIALPGMVHAEALRQLGRPPAANSAIVQLLRDLEFKEEKAEETRLKRAWQLSGGQAQRVAFARAIAHNPDIIFADEPTSGLDYDNALKLLQVLKGWLAEDANRTVLWVTHSKELAELADYSLRLESYGQAQLRSDVLTPARTPPKPSGRSAPFAAVPEQGQPPRRSINLAARLAASEMFSRRRALQHVDWQARLSHRLAHIHEPGARAGSVLLALPAMATAFRDWRTSVLFLLSGLLLFIAIAGFLVNWHLANVALSDPLACRMEVVKREGQAQRQFGRTEVGEKLAARPWLSESDAARDMRTKLQPGFGFAPADCRQGPGAFGRATLVGWGLGVIIDGKCVADRLVDARILVAPRNEPMFRRVDVEGSGKGGNRPKSLYDVLFDQGTFPGPDLFVAYDRYESLLEKVKSRLAPGQKIEQLCLVEGLDDASIAEAERSPFLLKAVVEDIPAGGRRRYDVYMPDDAYREWLQRRGGEGGDFDSAVIYFNPFDHAALGKFLADRKNGEFTYSTEDIRKVQERVYVFVATMTSIGLLCLIIVLILRSYLRNWFQYYLEVNEKPLAVLVAYGVGRDLLSRVVMVRALSNLGVGILIVVVLGVAVTGLAMAAWLWLVPDLNIDTAYLNMAHRAAGVVTPWSLALAVAVTVMAMGLVVWRMARASVRRWYKDNPYVAPILA